MINIYLLDPYEQRLLNTESIINAYEGFQVVGKNSTDKNLAEDFQKIINSGKHIDLIVIDLALNSIIETIDYFANNFTLGIIATIPKDADPELIRSARVAGADTFVYEPFTNEELLNGLRGGYKKLRVFASNNNIEGFEENISSDELLSNAVIFSFISAKGGIGQTTLMINAGIQIAQKTRERVAFVDLKLNNGDVGFLCGIETGMTIAELSDPGQIWYPEEIVDILPKGPENTIILAAPRRLEQLDLVNSEKSRIIIETLQQHTDFILIDLPTELNAYSQVVLDLSDYIILGTDLTANSIHNLANLIKALINIGVPSTKLLLAINDSHRPSSILSPQVEKHFDKKSLGNIPYDPQNSILAGNQGIPVSLITKKTPKIVYAYGAFADNLLEQMKKRL